MKITLKKDGLEGEKLEAVKELESSFNELDGITKEAAETLIDEKLKGIDIGASKEDISAIKAEIQKQFDEVEKAYSRQDHNGNQKTFNDNLSETVAEKMDDIKAAAMKGGETRLGAMKAVGNMSIAANFPGSTSFTDDLRTNNLIETPSNRVWLRDILLQGTTDGRTVTFPKENGGEGGAAPWTNPAVDKPQMDFDLTSVTNFVKWIAGFVIIDREMLDDYAFMDSWIRAKMLLSLKQAENNFILNGTADTNPVTGLLAAATAYTATPGLTASPVNNLLDAAWGQIPVNTNDFYSPTHAILHHRDAVKIGLNQASGSGEYDLPAGSVGFVNGKLNVGGLDVARTTLIPQNDFLVLDRNAAMFITKMAPELVVIVDSVLAKRNQIMLRIEERATLAIFNNDAIVTGELAVV